MARSKRRRLYSEEFKREAVELSKNAEKSVSEHAEDLGIHSSLLHRWRKQLLRDDGSVAPSEPSRVEQLEKEVERLQRKLSRTEQEREILKNAAAYFAREQD